MIATASARRSGRRHRLFGRAIVVAMGVGLAACSTPAQPKPVSPPPANAFGAFGQVAPGEVGQLSAISCTTDANCFAVGTIPVVPTNNLQPDTEGVVVASADAGQSWTTVIPSEQTSFLTGISCPSDQFCMAVGERGQNPSVGAVVTSTDSGHTWRGQHIPSGSIDLSAVTCLTSVDCLAIDTNGTLFYVAATHDGGSTWTLGSPLPAATGLPSAISCPSLDECVVASTATTAAAHGQGDITLTHDGGSTWSMATLPAGVGLLSDLSCVSVQLCFASGTSSTSESEPYDGDGVVLESTDGAMIWTASAAPVGVNDAAALSCADSRDCVVVGSVGPAPAPHGAVAYSSDGALKWVPVTGQYLPLALSTVYCPTATTCVAAGGNDLARISLPDPN